MIHACYGKHFEGLAASPLLAYLTEKKTKIKFTQGNKAVEGRLRQRLVTKQGELDFLVRETRESGAVVVHIFTHLFWDSVWGFCYACARLFKNEVCSHTFMSCLFVLLRLIISVQGCFTAVTVRHEPSRIVAARAHARAHLATRLG